MEPAVAGVLYAAENLVSGAAALVKGVTHPTLPLKAKLTHITSTPLLRSQHTISVVKGRAYIFGGETAVGQLADNTMHVVILPSSGVLEADCTSFPARAENGFGDVPSPRKGHSAVVIGDSIYVLGGQVEGDANEKGRVWVYHTMSNTWTWLDPASDTLYPSQRAGHGSASSNMPSPKPTTYSEKAPQAPVDPAKVVPEPAELNSWGTIFILGGRDTHTGELLNDALAFDVKSRAWSNIPSPPGQPREGTAVSLAGDHLYRFGGRGTESATSGATEFLDVSHVWTHAENGTTPLNSGWAWEEVSHTDQEGSTTAAPSARSNAGLVGVTTGQGRKYLLAIGGETESGGFLDEIWALQLPPEPSSAAAAKDNIRAKISKDTHKLEWAQVKRVQTDQTDAEKDPSVELDSGFGTRNCFGTAKGTEVDGATAVVWGGVDAEGKVLGDGWMIVVDR